MIASLPDHRQVYYSTQGAGPDLLIVHGAGGDADAYNALVDILSSQYHCITLDRLGYRRSTHLDCDTTVEEQVAAISIVHESVTAEPVWAFGHSSGSNFALAYALSHPDRVKGLILMEPALYGLYPLEQRPPEIDRLEQDILPMFKNGQIEQGLSGFFALIFGWHSFEGPISENWRFFAYDQPVVISWRPTEQELQKIIQPVLILEGDNSPPLLVNMCRLLDRKLPNSMLIILEDQDHLAPWTTPQLIAAELTTFISRCESKT